MPSFLLPVHLHPGRFSVFIEMMAVLAGESGFGMTIMRKGHRRPRPSPKSFEMSNTMLSGCAEGCGVQIRIRKATT